MVSGRFPVPLGPIPSPTMKSKNKSNQDKSDDSTNPFHLTKWTGARSDETEQEAQARVQQMNAAVKESKRIDLQLEEGRKALERRRRAIKILLLGSSSSSLSLLINRHYFIGQSESGKVSLIQ